VTRMVTNLAQCRAIREGWQDLLDQPSRDLGQALALISKYASVDRPVNTTALSGQLYASNSGWILLSVPNALVRGAFDALSEPGIELPLDSGGRLNAHISVMRAEEVEKIGGISKITERGHHFKYNVGALQAVKPLGWDGMSKVWFLSVTSPELCQLRRTYGLSSLPMRGDIELPFHITVARRAVNVLGSNDVSKGL